MAKYVDDICIILPKHLIDEFVSELNNFLPGKIEFTTEIENNGSLPFLDMLLVRQNDGHIKIDWYQKPTASNRTLNFHSQHPQKQKLAVAYGLFHRVLSLVDNEFINKNTTRIIDLLLENAYPYDVIMKQFHKFNSVQNNCHRLNTHTDNTNNETSIRRPVTYIQHVTDKIQRIMENKNPRLKIAYKPNNQLGNSVFTKLKQKVEKEDRTNCVYKIPCSDRNCAKSYIGQTKNQLKKRLGQHKTSVRAFKDGKPVHGLNDNDDCTALVLHSHKTGHYPDFDKTTIVDAEPHLSRRLSLESLHIYCNNTYNKRRDIQNISKTYAEVLENVKRSFKSNEYKNFRLATLEPSTVELYQNDRADNNKL